MNIFTMLDQMAQETMNPVETFSVGVPVEEEPAPSDLPLESEPAYAPTEPAPPPEMEEAAPVPVAPASGEVEIPPDVAYVTKGMRYKLVMEGACTHCAHCGQPLTDATSAERGIGPICSKKGYHDETPVLDDTEALLALSEFPALVDWLTKKYKPQGNRALCNGLVRTASLNRRTPVHAACCDAVDALGYKRLASALRESISVVEISDSKERPENLEIWVKKSDFKWAFWNELKAVPGVFMVKFPKRAVIVPKSQKGTFARLLVKHYEGLCVKTATGAHKITPEWFNRANKPAATPPAA